ncbi:MAG: MarR family transcriptional regulator [Blastocatellia bacterium]
MELLYNPDRMPEEEIKATFVAREQLVDELVALVEGQPDGAGVQHAVIIAPRGMGKTTVLLMVKFAIKDRGLADRWQAVKFPEESYGVYDLADFWIETLSLIAADTADTELRQLADDLKIKYPNNDELQEAAYATLKDWRRKHGKRLLLLVENFDQILEQINDERDNAWLRDVMMNDGTLMLLGGATTFFKEARAYDQPLYNFFKIYNLYDLKFAQMQELLSRRARVDRVADFETSLRRNEGRLRVLEYFTGGSPRIVLMLYRVVTQSNVDEVRRALDKLLDEVTPYYKAKIEILPPQQRKILDHIARVSGQTNEGLTPKEIAEAVRLPQNQVSAQLKRLSELGYVRAANLRGRSSFYMLSEPLYAIWHQMRFGRSARERMNWLVSFLKVWYAAEEMGMESERLDRRFRVEMRGNHPREARDLLEHHRYLTEAIGDAPVRARALERVIRGHLELKDAATVKGDLLIGVNLADLTDQMLDELLAADCVSREQVAQAKASRLASGSVSGDEEYVIAFVDGLDALEDRFDDAVRYFDRVLELKPGLDEVWAYRGVACLGWSLTLAQEEKFDAAREKWSEALASGGKSNVEYWPDVVTDFMLEVAKTGYLGFARQLIAEGGMEEQFFPLARAIDYLQTGDEALIKKLSPEVRGIVEEVVAKLKAVSQAGS